jgi:hypothetical protein
MGEFGSQCLALCASIIQQAAHVFNNAAPGTPWSVDAKDPRPILASMVYLRWQMCAAFKRRKARALAMICANCFPGGKILAQPSIRVVCFCVPALPPRPLGLGVFALNMHSVAVCPFNAKAQSPITRLLQCPQTVVAVRSRSHHSITPGLQPPVKIKITSKMSKIKKRWGVHGSMPNVTGGHGSCHG